MAVKWRLAARVRSYAARESKAGKQERSAPPGGSCGPAMPAWRSPGRTYKTTHGMRVVQGIQQEIQLHWLQDFCQQILASVVLGRRASTSTGVSWCGNADRRCSWLRGKLGDGGGSLTRRIVASLFAAALSWDGSIRTFCGKRQQGA